MVELSFEEILEAGKEAIRIEAESVVKACDTLDADFVEAVQLMLECKGRVVVTGMGKSGLIGKKIAATLASTGTPSLFLHPAEGVHGDLGMLVKGDVVIALSNSGETSEILSILPIIKRFKIPLISIVGKTESTLARKSDCVILGAVEREACPLNLAPTASTTVALALGDALAVALLKTRGFKEEDFAVFHPSGSLGRKLLKTVEDILHKDGSVPIVNRERTVGEALITMSEKKLGCTTVVDDEGKLCGMLTDGDLRRGLEKYSGLYEMKVKELANVEPKTINKDALAAKALQIMEEFEITMLVSVDENGKPDGIVHLHDILKTGLV